MKRQRQYYPFEACLWAAPKTAQHDGEGQVAHWTKTATAPPDVTQEALF